MYKNTKTLFIALFLKNTLSKKSLRFALKPISKALPPRWSSSIPCLPLRKARPTISCWLISIVWLLSMAILLLLPSMWAVCLMQRILLAWAYPPFAPWAGRVLVHILRKNTLAWRASSAVGLLL